jgi:demethylmenaquinone methyltransferase / 2-methoxy-6-polyprenyl-1,4-benzoquinol methylase
METNASYKIDNKTPEEKKKFIQNLFDSIVPTYDLLNRVLSGGIDMVWRINVFRHIRSVKGKRTIDLCCGTGDISTLLYRKGAKLTSLDFSLHMLKKGKKKGSLPGTSIAADASIIPFKDNTFHTATIAFGIRNIPDLDNFIKDVHRVLDSNGQFVILELVRPQNKVVGALYSFYLGTILPLIGGAISGKLFAYKYLSTTIATFIDPADLKNMLLHYGFSRVECYPQTFGIATIMVSTKEPS